MFDFTHHGRRFRATTEPETDNTPPWEWNDGHGPVSKWTTRAKQPGERILVSDHRSYRYYDVAEATRIARRDGWDAAPYGGTRGQRAARAVACDFERLRAWCNGDWRYVRVRVQSLDADGEPKTDEYENTVFGVESDYVDETACELADELLYAEARMSAIEAETAAIEAGTAAYWATHNVATRAACCC